MKPKKIVITSLILILLAVVYYVLFDWMMGYTEVKKALTQRLTEKYHGDQFEVLDLSYSRNLKGYNFEARDITKDITGAGSYFPESNKIWANSFKQKMMIADLNQMLRPYILKVGDNYYFHGMVSTVGAVTLNVSERMDIVDATLGYMYAEGVDARKWIEQYHESINLGIELRIQSQRDSESMYKVLKMAYDINNYLKSLKLGAYYLKIETFDVPKGFNIKHWYYVKYEAKSSSVNPDKDLYRYAWGYLNIKSCPDNPQWGKECNMNYQLNAKGKAIRNAKGESIWIPSTQKQRDAEHINRLADVAQYLQIYEYGKPRIERIIGQSGRKYVDYWWSAEHRRKTIPLSKMPYYPQVLRFIESDGQTRQTGEQ